MHNIKPVHASIYKYMALHTPRIYAIIRKYTSSKTIWKIMQNFGTRTPVISCTLSTRLTTVTTLCACATTLFDQYYIQQSLHCSAASQWNARASPEGSPLFFKISFSGYKLATHAPTLKHLKNAATLVKTIWFNFWNEFGEIDEENQRIADLCMLWLDEL